jgi:hypothetical protein
VRDEGDERPQRFSSGGRVTGVVGLVITAVFLLYGVLEPHADYAPWAWPLLLLIGVALWAVLVRPALVVRGDVLEMREILHSRFVPLARVTDVTVTHVTRVTADGRTYTGSGVGRSRRQLSRDERPGEAPRAADRSMGWLVEQKLSRLADHAREARELSGDEPPEVRRTWAWPEIAALAATAAATVVLALV